MHTFMLLLNVHTTLLLCKYNKSQTTEGMHILPAFDGCNLNFLLVYANYEKVRFAKPLACSQVCR